MANFISDRHDISATAEPQAGGSITGTTDWNDTGSTVNGYTIRSMAWDGAGLYAGTEGHGIWYFNPATSAWTDTGGLASGCMVAAMAWDGAGLYALANDKVVYFDPSASVWTDTGFGHIALSIACDGTGLYAGTSWEGVWRYDPGTSAWTSIGGAGSGGDVTSLAYDGTGLYAGIFFLDKYNPQQCGHLVKRYDPSSGTWTEMYAAAGPPIRVILAWDGAGIHAGVPDGFLRYDPETSAWSSNNWEGFVGEALSSLTWDGGTCLLAGTGSGRVFRYQSLSSTWTPVGSDLGDGTVCAVASGGSSIYAGYGGLGAWRYHKYADGEMVSLTATPNPGYHFVNWAEGGKEVSTAATYSFTATADRSLVANFAMNPVLAVTSVTPSSGVNLGMVGVTLEGTGFLDGATVTLRKAGTADITAFGVVVESGGKITCIVNLFGVQTGAWDVVVTNPDGQSTVLAGAFTVNPLISCGSGASGTLLLVGGMVGLLSLGQHSRRRRRRK